MKTWLELLYKISFFFGDKILPKLFKKMGVPSNTAAAACGYSNIWTGALLGAGGALIAVGAVIGVISGGALIAPTLLGSALLQGAVGAAATVVGFALLRAGEQALGFSFLNKAKDFLGLFKSKAPKNPAQPPAFEPSSSFNIKSIGNDFKNAVSAHKPQARKPYTPAFDGPML